MRSKQKVARSPADLIRPLASAQERRANGALPPLTLRGLAASAQERRAEAPPPPPTQRGLFAHERRHPLRVLLFLVAAVFLFTGMMPAPVKASSTELVHAYGGSGNDFAESVIEHSIDQGLVLAGWTTSYGAHNTDAFMLVKTDSVGVEMWTKTYGGSANGYAYSVIEHSIDNGLLMAGYSISTDAGFSTSTGAGGADYTLVKTDSVGLVLWTKIYGGSGDDRARSLIEHSIDNGIVMAGWTSNMGPGYYDCMLVKTNSAGEVLWTKTYGGFGLNYAFSVTDHSTDQGFVVAGNTNSFGAGGEDFMLVKTDSVGVELWTKTYGGINGDYAHSVIEHSIDNGLVLAGMTKSFVVGLWDFMLVKTDSLGLALWTKTYGGSGDDIPNSVIEHSIDNGFVIAGRTTNSFGGSNWNSMLVKTNSVGMELWTKIYGGVGHDYAYSVIEHSIDQEFVIAGRTESFGGEVNVLMLVVQPDNSGTGAGSNVTPTVGTQTLTGADHVVTGIVVSRLMEVDVILSGTDQAITSYTNPCQNNGASDSTESFFPVCDCSGTGYVDTLCSTDARVAFSDQTHVVGSGFVYRFGLSILANASSSVYQVRWTVTAAHAATETDWLVCDWTAQKCSGLPDKSAHLGVYEVKMVASDALQGSVTSSFTLDVTNIRPKLRSGSRIGDIKQKVNVFFERRVVGSDFFRDEDGHTLKYSVAMKNGGQLPSFLTIINAGSVLEISGTSPDQGVYALVVTADDTFGGNVSDNFKIMFSTCEESDAVLGTPISDPDSENRCVCRAGYYNAHPRSGLECTLCTVEIGLDCSDNGYDVGNMVVLPGFWRSSSNSTDVYPCLDSVNCLGSVALAAMAESDEQDTVTGMCVFPREGPLCALCVSGYYEDVIDGVCKTCKVSWFAIVFVTLGCLMGIAALVYYVRRIISNAGENSSNRGTLVKILFSALQMNAISLSFAFQFEGFFEQYLATQNAVSSMGTSALSLDCLWATSSSTVYPFYVETLVIMILPLVLLGLPMLILAVWFACNVARPNVSVIRERVMNFYFAGVVVVLFVAHPTLSKRAMKLFQCTQLAGEWRLKEQLEEECWSASHLLWVGVCGIPMLLVYVVGIPASALVILYRNRAAIPSAATAAHKVFHSKFSFLYKGYAVNDPERPYVYAWEIVVTSRKKLVMCFAIYFYESPPVQATLGIMVIVAALYLQAKESPFENDLLNRAETISLITSLLTFLLGSISFVDSDDDPYITSGVKVALSAFALLINAAFVAFIGYLFFRNQGERIEDSPSSMSTFGSHVKQARSGDDGVIMHVQQELGDKAVFDAVLGKPPSEGEHASRDMKKDTAHRFKMGMRVVVRKDDDTTYTTVTSSSSRLMVSVVDNKDPSGSVEVPCSRVQLLVTKEEDTHTHAHVAKQAADNPAQYGGILGRDSADDAQDATHTLHTHPAAAAAHAPQSLVLLPLFARPPTEPR